MSIVKIETQLLVRPPLDIEKILENGHLLFSFLNLFTKIEHNVVPRVAVLLLSIQKESPLLFQTLDVSIKSSQSQSCHWGQGVVY